MWTTAELLDSSSLKVVEFDDDNEGNLSSIDNVLALQEEMTKKDILAQH